MNANSSRDVYCVCLLSVIVNKSRRDQQYPSSSTNTLCLLPSSQIKSGQHGIRNGRHGRANRANYRGRRPSTVIHDSRHSPLMPLVFGLAVARLRVLSRRYVISLVSICLFLTRILDERALSDSTAPAKSGSPRHDG